jgi:transcriptional regulator with PAS, ATPase and Fis domain
VKTYAILPYRELTNIAAETSREHNLEMRIYEGNVEEAIPSAIEAQRKGAPCIISRGGTAAIIQRHIHIPIVHIRVSDLDLLRILYPLRGLNKTILVVGFRNAVYRCRSVARVLGLSIKELPVPYEESDYNFDNVKYAAERLIGTYGIDTIIGDQTAYVNLSSFCESQYLITSNKDDFLDAVERTHHSSSIIQKQHADFSHIQTVLDSVHDVVFSTDREGRITIFNHPAEEFFQCPQDEAIGARLQDIVRNSPHLLSIDSSIHTAFHDKQPHMEYLKNYKEEDAFVVHTNPLTVGEETKGVVATIKPLETQGTTTKAQKKKVRKYTWGFRTRYSFDDILTRDTKLQSKIRIAKGYAKTEATVLIEGESGVGKELFAQSIHSCGPRSDRPFVAVNCAAIPAQLLESELFGYVDGAFTGATKGGKRGLFEIADGGTIFLDEISEIDKSLQVRFLRVLEEKQIMRIGSDRLIDIDVRVIAATNRDLKEQVRQDHFRADLYYRLNLLNLRIPPLREHPADIEFLAQHFIDSFNKKYGMTIGALSPALVSQLKEYTWPGNVRELRNVMERVVLTIGHGCAGPLDIDLIASEIRESIDHERPSESGFSREGTLDEIKRNAARCVLEAEAYNKSRAARRLGIDRSTLDRLLSNDGK